MDERTREQHINALEKAISNGVQTISIGDHSITYRSVDEMFRVLQHLKSDSTDKCVYPSFISRRWHRDLL